MRIVSGPTSDGRGRGLLRRAARGVFDRVVLAQWRWRRPRVLFVLGHVRSGSTLLMHLLDHHPDVVAPGESWIEYDDPSRIEDLATFAHALRRDPRVRESWLVDKLLHDHLLPAEAVILASPPLALLFLLRRPERSLLSMMEHRATLKLGDGWDDVLAHYRSRLERMASIARRLDDPRRALFLRYEDLLEERAAALLAIERFLGLRTPLTSDYRVHRLTGVAGLGDFSAHIRAGTIVRTPRPDHAVPSSILAAAERTYASACAALVERCTVAVPEPVAS
jgi:hypothetical protein